MDIVRTVLFYKISSGTPRTVCVILEGQLWSHTHGRRAPARLCCPQLPGHIPGVGLPAPGDTSPLPEPLPSRHQLKPCLLPGLLSAWSVGLLCWGSRGSRGSPGAGLSPGGRAGLLGCRLAGRQRRLEGGRCELSVYSATSPRGRGELQHLHTKATERRESEHSRQPPPGCCSSSSSSRTPGVPPQPRQTTTCKAATRKARLAAQHHDVKDSTGCRTPAVLRHATRFGLSPHRDKLNVREQTTQLHLETNTDDDEVRALRISHVNTDVSLHTTVAPD